MPSRHDLKFLREKLRLSQAEFCRELGISQATLSNLESGKAPLPDSLLMRAAIRFRVPDLLVRRCDRCEVRETARELLPPLARNNQILATRQLEEEVTRAMDLIRRLAEELPSPSSTHFPYRLLELDEAAAKLLNSVHAYRFLIGR